MVGMLLAVMIFAYKYGRRSTVSPSHISILLCSDDALDFDRGWAGYLQHAFVALGPEADSAVELGGAWGAAGSPAAAAAGPFAVLSLTVLGAEHTGPVVRVKERVLRGAVDSLVVGTAGPRLACAGAGGACPAGLQVGASAVRLPAVLGAASGAPLAACYRATVNVYYHWVTKPDFD